MTAPALAAELFMIPDEVSEVLRVSRGDLRQMRDAGLGPAYFSIGSTIRYLQADVDQWRAAHPNRIQIPLRSASPRSSLATGGTRDTGCSIE